MSWEMKRKKFVQVFCLLLGGQLPMKGQGKIGIIRSIRQQTSHTISSAFITDNCEKRNRPSNKQPSAKRSCPKWTIHCVIIVTITTIHWSLFDRMHTHWWGNTLCLSCTLINIEQIALTYIYGNNNSIHPQPSSCMKGY